MCQKICLSLVSACFIALTAAVFPAQSAASETATRIIALGDMPYGPKSEVYAPYVALIGAINTRQPDLVIHVGDTKGGGACSDELLLEQLDFMNQFEAPLLYTPGDNEWTDCHRWGDGDPLDRLRFIRETYFAAPDSSLGQSPVALMHQGQDGFPENARYRVGGIGFITAHVVGSNNNLEARALTAAEEFFARSKASTEWLQAGFEAFADTRVMVVAIHADMFEFDFNHWDGERWLRHSGFGEFGEALKQAARDFEKPVLLVFGDSHEHRIFQPFPKYAPNITAVEVYGYPDMHAVEITIRPEAEQPFRIAPVWNPVRGN